MKKLLSTLTPVMTLSVLLLTAPVFSQTQTLTLTRSARDVAPAAAAPKKVSNFAGPLSPGSHNISLGVGQLFLIGDLSKTYENAIGTQVHYTYGVSDLFAFESNFGISSHSGALSTERLKMWNLTAGVRTNLVYFDQLVPFFSGGLGFYRPSYEYANGSTANSLLFGLQLGTGLELLMSDQFFFGSRLTLHNMFTSSKADSTGTRRDLGGSYFSFLVHLGFSFE